MQSTKRILPEILASLSMDEAFISVLEQTIPANVLNAETPGAVVDLIRQAGNILEVSQQAEILAEGLEERLNIIRHKLKFIAEEQKPEVLLLRSFTPEREAADNYISQLIQLAGGRIYRENNAGDSSGNPGPGLLLIATQQPIYSLLGSLPDILAQPQWAESAAVKNNRVYLLNGQQFLLGPGLSVADDVEVLAEIINPGQFIYGHNGEGWIQFNLA